MNIRWSAPFVALAVLALSACGGGGTTIINPTPGPTCAPGVTSQLLYPAPGQSYNASTITEVAIAVSAPLPVNTWNLALIANGNVTGYTYYPLQQISASQLPPGSAATTIPSPTYEEVNLISQLAGKTSWQVALNLPTSNCTPENIAGGTFSTL